MKIKHKYIERFLKVMAFYVEAYPTDNIKTNRYWASIRRKYDMDCLKWGKCEICGIEELLGEYGLTWICDRHECLKIVEQQYKESHRQYHEDRRNEYIMKRKGLPN
jgi:hypothetical protein